MGFTDIRFDLIARLPKPLRVYALLLRLDRPVGWWLLLLPGWWAIALAGGGILGMGPRQWGLMILFLIGAIIMRGAGCIVNDLWDRDLDAKVTRTRLRPIASGAISPRQALLTLALMLCMGLLILLQTSWMCGLLGLASLFFVAIYPVMKRITWWPQAFLGLTFNFSALMGWAAVSNDVPLPALLLYAAGFFWTLGYDTIYAHQDKEDDMMAGIKSTALLFGAQSKKWVRVFYGLSWILIGAAAFVETGSPAVFLFLIPVAVHFGWQVQYWKVNDPASALRMFKANRDAGLLILIALLFS
jgi:4-hydroxybenzoate polyprenyltransferase